MRMRKLGIPLCISVLLAVSFVLCLNAQTPGEIIAYAGNAASGYAGDGGPAVKAELHTPIGVTLDSSGNLYIADADNDCIRKVTAATGIITTVVGECTIAGYTGDGGLATSAELNSPGYVKFDKSGNMYFTDVNNYVVRRVDAATGVITTVAGDGTRGYAGDGGPATSAEIDPSGLAVDSSGNIYIGNFFNSGVRKVTMSTGIITTVAGNGTEGYTGDGGPATSAELSVPQGLAVDSANNLYILDQNGNAVRKVAASTGIITTVAGKGTPSYFGDGGPATSASLAYATDVAVDPAGNLFITDTFNFRIRKVTAATGIITTVAGNGTAGFSGNGGLATNAEFSYPYGITVDSSDNFYVSDIQNAQVRKVFAGGLAQSATTLTLPRTPPLAGQSFQITAKVTGQLNSPVPTGTVTFLNGTVALGSAPLDSTGMAVLTTSMSAGTYNIVAKYSGDSFYAASSGTSNPLVVAATAAQTPWFGPAGGTYTYNLLVAINSSPGVTIIYTTDGTTPSLTNGKYYQGALPVTSNITIKAIAMDLRYAPAYANSSVSTASYVINLPYEAPLPQGEWAWESGGGFPPEQAGSCTGYPGVLAIYGSLGVPAPNNVPSSRTRAAQWTDKNGNLWLFGGSAQTGTFLCGYVNDLWMFNTSSKQWAWMSGSNSYPNGFQPGVYGTLGQFASGNVPGSREGSVAWTDKSGNLWLFGGDGYDSTGTYGYLNDVWEFNPTTRQWAWMAGSKVVNQRGAYGYIHVAQAGNTPGGRWGAAGWTDLNGTFWLFGGYAYDGTGAKGLINDLWEFNPATRQWAWMGGSHVTYHYGVYGKLHVPGASNIPGARFNASAWIDLQGNFWLFGGFGDGAPTTVGSLNDLWEFNPNNLNWTWAAGNSRVGTYLDQAGQYGQAGVYDTLGTPDPGNTPGSRRGASSWTDTQGNLWLYGGLGFDSVGSADYLDDLWEFDRSKWLWAWMGGSNLAQGQGSKPVYGTYQVASPQTWPGPRSGAANWTDKNGNFWLFGGAGRNANSAVGTLNDVFEYKAP